MFDFWSVTLSLAYSSSPDPSLIWFSGSERRRRGEGRPWQSEEGETGVVAQRWWMEWPRGSHNQLSGHLPRLGQQGRGRPPQEGPERLWWNLTSHIWEHCELQIYNSLRGKKKPPVSVLHIFRPTCSINTSAVAKPHQQQQEAGSLSSKSKKTLHNANRR